MDWRNEAIEKLKQYEAKKMALKSIPLEIRKLELDMQAIRSATADGSPVRGGGNKREDMYLSNLVYREELERALKRARTWVSLTKAALDLLSDEERLLLDRFYIHPEKRAADRLAGDLRVDVKTVYKRKDEALRKFTICLYGEIEN